MTKKNTDPLNLAHRLWQKARRNQDDAAETLSLATVDLQGAPSVRTVLIKGINDRGISFVTRKGSPKTHHIDRQPLVECVAHWNTIRTQLRFRGEVMPMPREEVKQLWKIRPRDAQLLYHLQLAQSEVIPSFRHLVNQIKAMRKQWHGTVTIPLSEQYIGFTIKPIWIEILEHRITRINHRIRYLRAPSGWKMETLAP